MELVLDAKMDGRLICACSEGGHGGGVRIGLEWRFRERKL